MTDTEIQKLFFDPKALFLRGGGILKVLGMPLARGHMTAVSTKHLVL